MKNLYENTSTVLFKKVVHKKSVRLLLVFKYHEPTISKIRDLKLFLWSQSLRGWHCEFDLKVIQKVHIALKNIASFEMDSSIGKEFELAKTRASRNISDRNKEIIRGYVSFLKGKRYSESTVRSYFTLIADFIAFIQPIPIDDLTHRNVELFIESVYIKRDYSVSTQRQLISAIKQFVLYYPNCKVESIKLIRPKSSSFLPTVLSKQEVISILRCTIWV